MARTAKIPNTQPLAEPATHELYLKDSYAWALHQAEAMRRRDFGAVDWGNVIEEIEDLARSDARRLTSQYARTIQHLLKLQHRHPGESDPVRGWKHSIDDARTEIHKILRGSHRLKSIRHTLLANAWSDGRADAIKAFVADATRNIKTDSIYERQKKRLRREWNQLLPDNIPYTLNQLETPDWYPTPKTVSRRPLADRHSGPEMVT